MADVIFVAVICAFFALCVVYIRWCDRIIGPDEFTTPTADGPVDTDSADASTTLHVASGVTV